MRWNLFLLFLLLGPGVFAQPVQKEEVPVLRSNARQFLQSGDYANAIMVYNQLIALEPSNLTHRRQLAQVYFLQGNLKNAEKTVSPLLKEKNADAETFQVACLIFSAMKRYDEAKDVIHKGLQKFPGAGMLYKEKADLLLAQEKYSEATEALEKGVEHDPSFPQNYYNLSKMYFYSRNYLRAIYTGEIFLNLEPFTARSEEMKKNIFESYKLLIASLNELALNGKADQYENPKNFEQAVLQSFMNVRNTVSGGVHVSSLTMLRIRFLLYWNKMFARIYPCELFDQQQRLLLNGCFEAYNQWCFGRSDQEKQYIDWARENSTTMNRFDTWFRSHPLSIPQGQFYFTK